MSVPEINFLITFNVMNEDCKAALEEEVLTEYGETATSSFEWDYSQNGADWPDKFPDCGLPQQSPVNLLTAISEYG